MEVLVGFQAASSNNSPSNPSVPPRARPSSDPSGRKTSPPRAAKTGNSWLLADLPHLAAARWLLPLARAAGGGKVLHRPTLWAWDPNIAQCVAIIGLPCQSMPQQSCLLLTLPTPLIESESQIMTVDLADMSHYGLVALQLNCKRFLSSV